MNFAHRFVSSALFASGILVCAMFLFFSTPSPVSAAGFFDNVFQRFSCFLGNNCSGTSCTPVSIPALPVLEVVPGYVPPSITPNFAQFSIPNTSGGRPRGLPAAVKQAWYTNMPSPGIGCSGGLCLNKDFSGRAGVRVTAIIATPKLELLGELQIPRVGLDLVNFKQPNGCGKTFTHWAYATAPVNNSTPSAAFKVPKGTPVQVSYECQPSNDYYWTTSTACFLWIGTCNIADHNLIFRLSDRSKINGVAQDVLHKTETVILADAGTFTLQCGGYKPEDGTLVNGGVPTTYDSTNVRRGNDWWNDHPDTYGFYNAIAPDYYHPEISLKVEECTGDDEIVVNSVCKPCSEVKPGSYRIDNVCVTSTPTLNIEAFVNGKPTTTVPVGTKVTIQATYVSTISDPLVGASINGGTKDKDAVVCSLSGCITTMYNAQKTLATSTYTFTPSAAGVYTFYPSVKTTILSVWKNYGDVSKTLTVGAPCPANATPSGNSCACNDQYYNYVGNSCVLMCPASMHSTKANNSCISNLPSAEDITFSATQVRSGNPSTLSWSITGITDGISCTIAPTPASGQINWDGNNPWSGTAWTVPITQPTYYTLTCSNGEDVPVSKTVTVKLIPVYQEI